jgi:PilZ domain
MDLDCGPWVQPGIIPHEELKTNPRICELAVVALSAKFDPISIKPNWNAQAYCRLSTPEYLPARNFRQPKMAHHIARLRNRRTFDRHDINLPATVHSGGGAQVVVLRNISPAGVRLESAVGLILGDVVTIEIAPSHSLVGRVAWSSTSSCGVEFQFLLAEDDPLLGMA